MTEQQPAADQDKENRLWTAVQVAEFFQVSPSYIYELIKARCIPHGKIGRFVRFDPGEIKTWWNLRKRIRR